mmetsp:Transcript_5690/g.21479  ORF Transcript_5690/g.21479 Transcript_5690/m.21479 type:complete len:226 (-) Transcript_5690:450-1127(-)
MRQGAVRRLHRRAAQAPAAGQGKQVSRALLRPRDGATRAANRGGGRVREQRRARQHRLAHLPRRVPQPVRERCVRRAGPPRGVPRIVPLPRGHLRAALRHLLAAEDVRGVVHSHPPILPHWDERTRGARGRDRHCRDPRQDPEQHSPVEGRAVQHTDLRHPRAAGAVLLWRQHPPVLRVGDPSAPEPPDPVRGRRQHRDRLPRRGGVEEVPRLLQGDGGGGVHQS